MLVSLVPTLHDQATAPRSLPELQLQAADGATSTFSAPLLGLRVRARLAGPLGEVELTQHFLNPQPHPLEAVYWLPVPEGAAVLALELRCGDQIVTADLQGRQEAQATYQDALQQGLTSALLSAERRDVLLLRAGRLPPGRPIQVRVRWIEPLPHQDGAWSWRLPTTLAPRYTPGAAIGHDGPGISPDTDLVPDASRLSPPLALHGGAPLDLEVHLEGPVRRLASNSHCVTLSLEDGGLRVAPTGARLDRDFRLSWVTAAERARQLRGWSDGEHALLLLEPPEVPGEPPLPRDATFLVDISGSMEGAKLQAAKLALHTALHGLLPGDRFRLLAFDDRVEAFAPGWTEVTDRALEQADRWVRALRARGGTEMLPALQAAFQPDAEAGRPRTVLFLTDGQSNDEARLVAAVHFRRQGARLFTLGIDTAVNAGLLERLARIGGGTCTLLRPDDPIEPAVAALEARFGGPLAELDALPEAADPTPALLYAGAPALAVVRSAATTLTWGGLGCDLTPSPLPLAAVYAHRRVAWLEDRLATAPHQEEALRPEIRRVALRGRVLSSETSWVAVNREGAVLGPLVTTAIPHALPQAWAGGPSAAPAPFPPPGGPGASPTAPRAAPTAAPAPPPRATGGPSLMKKLAAAVDRSRAALGPPPSPAPAAAMEAPTAPSPAPADLGATLAAAQAVDGSFGGDPLRTAAALLALVLLGHTRRAGLRQRVVQKAARWLESQPPQPAIQAALVALAEAEAGHRPRPSPAWEDLRQVSPEGGYLPPR